MLTFTSATPSCAHLADPAQRLGQVRRATGRRRGCPSTSRRGASHGSRLAVVVCPFLRIRDAVEDVQPGGEHQVGHCGADRREDVAGQPGAVLVSCRRSGRARLRRQQLVEQVAVALLDVDELEADVTGELRRGDVVVDEPLRSVVVDQRIAGVDLAPCADRAAGRATAISGVRVAVPAGVRQLQAERASPSRRRTLGAVRLRGTLAQHAVEAGGGVRRDPAAAAGWPGLPRRRRPPRPRSASPRRRRSAR